MKKVSLFTVIAVMALVSSGVFYACQKDESLSQEKVALAEKEKIEKAKVTITISWTEWGRAKKGCAGAGLCNFDITIKIESNTQPLEPKSAEVYTDGNGNSFADVLIDQDFVFDEESTSFYIDEALEATAPNGSIYIIPEGVYEFNSDLGTLGGYTIPIISYTIPTTPITPIIVE